MITGRILVVEDEQTVLQMTSELLASEGFEVIELRFPELVLEVVEHERPDLILVDIMLPERSGIEVADALWVNGFGTIPLIAMSASCVMADLAHASPFFQRVLRKPFDIDELLGAVQSVLSANSVAREVEEARQSI